MWANFLDVIDMQATLILALQLLIRFIDDADPLARKKNVSTLERRKETGLL